MKIQVKTTNQEQKKETSVNQSTTNIIQQEQSKIDQTLINKNEQEKEILLGSNQKIEQGKTITSDDFLEKEEDFYNDIVFKTPTTEAKQKEMQEQEVAQNDDFDILSALSTHNLTQKNEHDNSFEIIENTVKQENEKVEKQEIEQKTTRFSLSSSIGIKKENNQSSSQVEETQQQNVEKIKQEAETVIQTENKENVSNIVNLVLQPNVIEKSKKDETVDLVETSQDLTIQKQEQTHLEVENKTEEIKNDLNVSLNAGIKNDIVDKRETELKEVDLEKVRNTIKQIEEIDSSKQVKLYEELQQRKKNIETQFMQINFQKEQTEKEIKAFEKDILELTGLSNVEDYAEFILNKLKENETFLQTYLKEIEEKENIITNLKKEIASLENE